MFAHDCVRLCVTKSAKCILFLTGERRYHCFANIPTDKAFSKDSVWNIKHVQEMDESDPINDLEDYNEEVLKEVNINFSRINENFSNFFHGDISNLRE